MHAKRYFCFAILVSFCLWSHSVRAKDSTARASKARFTLSAGYGFPSTIKFFMKNFVAENVYAVNGSGPYILKAEYAINKRFGIGLSSSYNYYNIYLKFIYSHSILIVNDFNINLKGNYYFINTNKSQLYAGLGLGYNYLKNPMLNIPHPDISVKNFVTFSFPMSAEATVGYRYFPLKRIGLYSEIGLGKTVLALAKKGFADSYLQGGISIRL